MLIRRHMQKKGKSNSSWHPGGLRYQKIHTERERERERDCKACTLTTIVAAFIDCKFIFFKDFIVLFSFLFIIAYPLFRPTSCVPRWCAIICHTNHHRKAHKKTIFFSFIHSFVLSLSLSLSHTHTHTIHQSVCLYILAEMEWVRPCLTAP